MLVVGKEANTLSTLHGIANCVKNRTREIVSSNRYQRLAHCSVAHTCYFRSGLRILFTVLSEKKTQLWKFMWDILRVALAAVAAPCFNLWSICHNFCLTLILISLFYGVVLSYLKIISDNVLIINVLMIKPYIRILLFLNIFDMILGFLYSVET